MGACGKGSEAGIQVLPAHRGWKEATGGGGVEVEENDRRDRADHVACRGELRCAGGARDLASRIWTASCAPTWSWKPKNSRIPVSIPSRRASPPDALSEILLSQKRRYAICGAGPVGTSSFRISVMLCELYGRAQVSLRPRF